jgi:hypothetical protein
VASVIDAAFTAASHAGWLVTTGAGVAIAVIGVVSASPWALRRAAAAVGDPDQ